MTRSESYLRHYAGQLPVLGRRRQAILRGTTVHIGGLGRVGTSILFDLISSGVMNLSANDPQTIAEDNLGPLLYARLPDVGRPKVVALERFLHHRREEIRFVPIHAPSESPAVECLVEQCDVVVICSNTVESRRAMERAAIRHGKPSVNVGLADGRKTLGGMISLRLPKVRNHACAGCLLPAGHDAVRGEGLLFPVVSMVASHAAQLVVQIATGTEIDKLAENNVWYVDASSHRVLAMAVRPRLDCDVCGPGREARSR